MAIPSLHVAGYHSVRDVRLALNSVNVLVGPNGCGRTNLYLALYLLAAAAEGRFARTLAEEGGMPSVLWARERSRGPVRLTVGGVADDLEYAHPTVCQNTLISPPSCYHGVTRRCGSAGLGR